MKIFVEFTFDAAHFLPFVPAGHKCGRMHGHTYRMTVWVVGPVDPKLGWVIDYAMVKSAVDASILIQLDHHLLNEIAGLENPTCEVLAAWIGQQLAVVNLGPARFVELELRETARAGVRLVIDPFYEGLTIPGTRLELV